MRSLKRALGHENGEYRRRFELVRIGFTYTKTFIHAYIHAVHSLTRESSMKTQHITKQNRFH